MVTPSMTTQDETNRYESRRTPSLLLPEDPSQDELAQYWTLSARDQAEVMRCRTDATRRRFAVQLCTLRAYGRLVVYLSPADKYPRLTRRLSQRAKRPKRESSHGLSAALSPLVTPSKQAVRTHVAGSGSLSLPLPTTVACSYPR